MFNRFTERARKVIILAKEEARRFNHDYIDRAYPLRAHPGRRGRRCGGIAENGRVFRKYTFGD